MSAMYIPHRVLVVVQHAKVPKSITITETPDKVHINHVSVCALLPTTLPASEAT